MQVTIHVIVKQYLLVTLSGTTHVTVHSHMQVTIHVIVKQYLLVTLSVIMLVTVLSLMKVTMLVHQHVLLQTLVTTLAH